MSCQLSQFQIPSLKKEIVNDIYKLIPDVACVMLIIQILNINSTNTLIIISAVIGGIVSGLSSITALALVNIFRNKKDKRDDLKSTIISHFLS